MTTKNNEININWELYSSIEGYEVINNILTKNFIKELENAKERIYNDDKNSTVMALKMHGKMTEHLEQYSAFGANDSEGRGVLQNEICKHLDLPKNVFN